MWVVSLWASCIPCVRDVRGGVSIPGYTSEEHFCFCSESDPDSLHINLELVCHHYPACRENEILTALPPCFPLLLVHHIPPKGPVLPLAGTWCEPFGRGPVLTLPRGALGCSNREGDHPPMLLELGGVKVRGQRSQPHRQSQLLAATLSLLWITWKSPPPSASAAALAPFCCSIYSYSCG